MLYFRLVQVINAKLESMQDSIWREQPDADLPMTTKQLLKKQY